MIQVNNKKEMSKCVNICIDCGETRHASLLRKDCQFCTTSICDDCGQKCPKCKTNLILNCGCSNIKICSDCLITFLLNKCNLTEEQAIGEINQI